MTTLTAGRVFGLAKRFVGASEGMTVRFSPLPSKSAGPVRFFSHVPCGLLKSEQTAMLDDWPPDRRADFTTASTTTQKMLHNMLPPTPLAAPLERQSNLGTTAPPGKSQTIRDTHATSQTQGTIQRQMTAQAAVAEFALMPMDPLTRERSALEANPMTDRHNNKPPPALPQNERRRDTRVSPLKGKTTNTTAHAATAECAPMSMDPPTHERSALHANPGTDRHSNKPLSALLQNERQRDTKVSPLKTETEDTLTGKVTPPSINAASPSRSYWKRHSKHGITNMDHTKQRKGVLLTHGPLYGRRDTRVSPLKGKTTNTTAHAATAECAPMSMDPPTHERSALHANPGTDRHSNKPLSALLQNERQRDTKVSPLKTETEDTLTGKVTPPSINAASPSRSYWKRHSKHGITNMDHTKQRKRVLLTHGPLYAHERDLTDPHLREQINNTATTTIPRGNAALTGQTQTTSNHPPENAGDMLRYIHTQTVSPSPHPNLRNVTNARLGGGGFPWH